MIATLKQRTLKKIDFVAFCDRYFSIVCQRYSLTWLSLESQVKLYPIVYSLSNFLSKVGIVARMKELKAEFIVSDKFIEKCYMKNEQIMLSIHRAVVVQF